LFCKKRQETFVLLIFAIEYLYQLVLYLKSIGRQQLNKKLSFNTTTMFRNAARHLGSTIGSGGRHGHPSSNQTMTTTLSSLARPSLPRWMPVKSVQVFSLEGAERAKLVKMAPTGTVVHAGDIVAVLETVPKGKLIEVASPLTGQLTKIKIPLQEIVQVGDDLMEVDTDFVIPTSSQQQQQPQTQQQLDSDALLQHLKQNKGELQEQFFQQYLKWKDIPRLQQLVQTIRDRVPNLKVKALTLLEYILKLQMDTYAPPAQVAATHTDLGIVLYQLKYLEAAVGQLRRALDIRKVALMERHAQEEASGSDNHKDEKDKNDNGELADLAASHIHLGACLNQMGDLDGTFTEFQEALQIQKKLLGEEHPIVAASWNNLGAIQYQKGDFTTAAEYYRQALEIQQKVLGAEHVDTAGTHSNLGIALKHLGEYPAAMDAAKESLRIRQKLLPLDSPDVAASHYALGQLYSEIGELDLALEEYKKSTKIQESVYGLRSPITASGYNNIGAVLYQKQDFNGALVEYRRGLDMLHPLITILDWPCIKKVNWKTRSSRTNWRGISY
jgi:tetratricopeptide (TPR) repeat protein